MPRFGITARSAWWAWGPVPTAAYGGRGPDWETEPRQHLTYFEIDSKVRRISEDRKFFTYLSDCRDRLGDNLEIRMGDARLTLAREHEGKFDVLLIDAFSSDAIPIHLITCQAVEMYFEKLAPHGLLMVHLSNRHLRLEPVVAATADHLQLVARVRDDDDENYVGKSASTWAVLAQSEDDLGKLKDDKDCGRAQARPQHPALDRRLLQHRQRDELGVAAASGCSGRRPRHRTTAIEVLFDRFGRPDPNLVDGTFVPSSAHTAGDGPAAVPAAGLLRKRATISRPRAEALSKSAGGGGSPRRPQLLRVEIARRLFQTARDQYVSRRHDLQGSRQCPLATSGHPADPKSKSSSRSEAASRRGTRREQNWRKSGRIGSVLSRTAPVSGSIESIGELKA